MAARKAEQRRLRAAQPRVAMCSLSDVLRERFPQRPAFAVYDETPLWALMPRGPRITGAAAAALAFR